MDHESGRAEPTGTSEQQDKVRSSKWAAGRALERKSPSDKKRQAPRGAKHDGSYGTLQHAVGTIPHHSDLMPKRPEHLEPKASTANTAARARLRTRYEAKEHGLGHLSPTFRMPR